MDLLSILKAKQSEQNEEVHPLAYKNHAFKYLYCFGIGVLALGHMKAIAELQNGFDELLKIIMLNENCRDKIIIDINNNFDYKVNDVFKILDTKEKQYTFTVDLLKLTQNALWSQSYCENVIAVYMSIFKFSKSERKFFKDFTEATQKNNSEQARKVYSLFVKEGYYIKYKILKYMCGKFSLLEDYKDITLDNGIKMILDKDITINGDIRITNGSNLLIDGANIKINGCILVDGGRIQIRNSNIEVRECRNKYFIQVANSTLVSVEDSNIECNFKCGFIRQEQGYLVLNNSKICHTALERTIDFSGRELVINGTEFEEMKNGAIAIREEASMQIDDCKFLHCRADNGGAIFADSLYDGTVSNCIFYNCSSKYLGSAIYFVYKKYGQEVYQSEFVKCIPTDSIIFNSYSEKNNMFNEGVL